MEDTLDVLKISRDDSSAVRKKPRTRTRRPEGISREAYSLLDGNHPVVQTIPYRKALIRKDGPSKKRKPDVSYTVSYKWKTFRNEARSDGLELKRWVKCFTDRQGQFREANSSEYPFAKLNKEPDVIRYTIQEWEQCLSGLAPVWSREETDYLLELCRKFSLRFPVIHDRYAFQGGHGRSYEELKERYYSMASALACFRSCDELHSKSLMKNPYDAEEERRRRAACRAVMEMTMEEEYRDAAILEEAERIEARRLESATLTEISDVESEATPRQTVDQEDEMPLHDSDGRPYRPEPGIYLRSATRPTMTPTSVKQKAMHDFAIDQYFPSMCTKSLTAAWIDLYHSARALSRLREQIDAHVPKPADSRV